MALSADVRHLHAPVYGLADEQRALGRHPPSRGATELQAVALVLDHVVLPNHAGRIETEDIVIPNAPIPTR